jgi:orotate phosphoribosyltransferase
MSFQESSLHTASPVAQLRRDPDWHALREIIRARSFSQGEARKLVSGVTSNFYFDMKKTLADAEGGLLVAKLLVKLLRERPCDFVGGLEMGAVPIATSVMIVSGMQGSAIPFFWVRKKPKEHGTQALIEGPSPEALAGKTAIVVEDVTTTGESSMKAVAAVRAAGARVDTVITIVDRLEGASENMPRQNLELLALYTADDFRT